MGREAFFGHGRKEVQKFELLFIFQNLSSLFNPGKLEPFNYYKRSSKLQVLAATASSQKRPEGKSQRIAFRVPSRLKTSTFHCQSAGTKKPRGATKFCFNPLQVRLTSENNC